MQETSRPSSTGWSPVTLKYYSVTGVGGGRNTTIETSFVHHHLFQASGSVLGFTMSADKGQKPSECHTAVKPTPSLEPFAIGISTKLSNLST